MKGNLTKIAEAAREIAAELNKTPDNEHPFERGECFSGGLPRCAFGHVLVKANLVPGKFLIDNLDAISTVAFSAAEDISNEVVDQLCDLEIANDEIGDCGSVAQSLTRLAEILDREAAK